MGSMAYVPLIAAFGRSIVKKLVGGARGGRIILEADTAEVSEKEGGNSEDG